MNKIYHDEQLRKTLGQNGIKRFSTFFDLQIMVESYRNLILNIAPPIILLDMDGAVVDWDKGFRHLWNNRSEINRNLSYAMENCVSYEYKTGIVNSSPTYSISLSNISI